MGHASSDPLANVNAEPGRQASLSGGAGKSGDPVGLSLVAVPIGNLGDITLRALDCLRQVDLIACEDTRVTRRLLAAHGIRNRLLAYHDHNAERVRPALLRRLAEGRALALVCDAGTPLISDPGFRLVQACIAQSVPVTMLPGASACLPALALSGLPTDRFYFGGFLAATPGGRRRAFAALRALPASLVFFESPRRLAAALRDAAETLGDRPASVARELTKRHETLARGRLDELAALYAASEPPRGELVLVIGGAGTATGDDDGEDGERDRDEAIDAALRARPPGESLRDAVREAAAAGGWPRRLVYRRALAVRGRRDAAP